MHRFLPGGIITIIPGFEFVADYNHQLCQIKVILQILYHPFGMKYLLSYVVSGMPKRHARLSPSLFVRLLYFSLSMISFQQHYKPWRTFSPNLYKTCRVHRLYQKGQRSQTGHSCFEEPSCTGPALTITSLLCDTLTSPPCLSLNSNSVISFLHARFLWLIICFGLSRSSSAYSHFKKVRILLHTALILLYSLCLCNTQVPYVSF